MSPSVSPVPLAVTAREGGIGRSASQVYTPPSDPLPALSPVLRATTPVPPPRAYLVVRASTRLRGPPPVTSQSPRALLGHLRQALPLVRLVAMGATPFTALNPVPTLSLRVLLVRLQRWVPVAAFSVLSADTPPLDPLTVTTLCPPAQRGHTVMPLRGPVSLAVPTLTQWRDPDPVSQFALMDPTPQTVVPPASPVSRASSVLRV